MAQFPVLASQHSCTSRLSGSHRESLALISSREMKSCCTHLPNATRNARRKKPKNHLEVNSFLSHRHEKSFSTQTSGCRHFSSSRFRFEKCFVSSLTRFWLLCVQVEDLSIPFRTQTHNHTNTHTKQLSKFFRRNNLLPSDHFRNLLHSHSREQKFLRKQLIWLLTGQNWTFVVPEWIRSWGLTWKVRSKLVELMEWPFAISMLHMTNPFRIRKSLLGHQTRLAFGCARDNFIQEMQIFSDNASYCVENPIDCLKSQIDNIAINISQKIKFCLQKRNLWRHFNIAFCFWRRRLNNTVCTDKQTLKSFHNPNSIQSTWKRALCFVRREWFPSESPGVLLQLVNMKPQFDLIYPPDKAGGILISPPAPRPRQPSRLPLAAAARTSLPVMRIHQPIKIHVISDV